MRSLTDPPRGVDNNAEEVVKRVANVTTGLVVQREESVALRHGVTSQAPFFRAAPQAAPYPGKRTAAAQYLESAPTTVRTSVIMLRSAPRMATSGRLPELRTSLPYDRPAIRASRSQTPTKGPCHKCVRVERELLHPSTWSPNSSTERDGSSRLLSRVDSLWQPGHRLRSPRVT